MSEVNKGREVQERLAAARARRNAAYRGMEDAKTPDAAKKARQEYEAAMDEVGHATVALDRHFMRPLE